MTVRENLEMGGYARSRRDAGSASTACSTRFPMLAEAPRRAARTLSGGQRQILAMAMALMVRAGAAAARRAVGRTVADRRRDAVRDHPGDQSRRHRHRHGGAERHAGAGDRASGDILVDGRNSRDGAGRRAGRRPRDPPHLPGRLTPTERTIRRKCPHGPLSRRRGVCWQARRCPCRAGHRRAQGAPLQLGVLTPLTGAGGFDGPRMLKAMQAVANEINAAGGLLGRKIELVVEDDQTNPEAGGARGTQADRRRPRCR